VYIILYPHPEGGGSCSDPDAKSLEIMKEIYGRVAATPPGCQLDACTWTGQYWLSSTGVLIANVCVC
jgi:hypothetical protein